MLFVSENFRWKSSRYFCIYILQLVFVQLNSINHTSDLHNILGATFELVVHRRRFLDPAVSGINKSVVVSCQFVDT